MTQMAGFDGGFQQPLALPPDSANVNDDFVNMASCTGAVMTAALTPMFIPVKLPGVAIMPLDSMAARVTTPFAGSTIGLAIYSGVVGSSDNITLTLVCQLNALLSGAAAGKPNAKVTLGAVGSGAATALLDFTQNRYWASMMVSDITTLAMSSVSHGATLTDVGMMRYTAAARSSASDWPASITQASLGVPGPTRFPYIGLLTATGINLI